MKTKQTTGMSSGSWAGECRDCDSSFFLEWEAKPEGSGHWGVFAERGSEEVSDE